MPHYVVLANFTDEGVRNIRDLPKQVQNANQRIAAAGMKVERFFTLGQYDIVVMVEAPNDEVVATSALAIAGQGHVRTTTLRAFTEDEFFKLLEGLPNS